MTNLDFYHRTLDRIEEWLRYPQPSKDQEKILGMYTDVIDYDFTAARLASEESAKYYIEHMRTVPNFNIDYDLQSWIATQIDSKLLKKRIGIGVWSCNWSYIKPFCTFVS